MVAGNAHRLLMALTLVALRCSMAVGSGSEAVDNNIADQHGPMDLLKNVLGFGQTVPTPRSEGISVISAGASKTGTKTMQIALEMLGYKTYDVQNMQSDGHFASVLDDVMFDKNDVPRGFSEAARRDPERNHYVDIWHNAILDGGYNATLEMAHMFWEELLERNPKAKVVLCTHHSGDVDKWFQSFANTGTAFAGVYGMYTIYVCMCMSACE